VDIKPHPALRRLLGDDGLAQQVEAGAAPFARRLHLPQAQAARLGLQAFQHVRRHLDGVVRKLVLFRLNLLLHEAADGLLQHPQIFRQLPGAVTVIHS